MPAVAQHARTSSLRAHSCCTEWTAGPGLPLARASSAVDMRQLTASLLDAREGTGEVRAVLLRAAFRPRLPGLTKLVSKLSKEGAWRKALEVFEAVDEMGLVPDTALTNSAISACDKGGRWQKALEIFEGMERHCPPLPRDAITYSATISALAKGKQWHTALQIFDHMQVHGIDADVVTCCSLINALERGGQWQLAEKLFLQMCTVQDGGEAQGTEAGVGLPRLLSSPSAPHAPICLHRAQTSPSSVLDTLQSPPRGCLMSIAESPRSPQASPAIFDLGSPALAALPSMPGGLPAALGLLVSAASPSSQQDVLGGLFGSAQGADGVDGLSSRLNAALSLTGGNGFVLERVGSADSSGGPPNPFAAASKLVTSLRKASPTSSMASFQIPENEEAVFHQAPNAAGSDSPPSPALPRLPPAGGSPQRPASSASLARSPSLKRELGIPQLEAAQSLRRAMSCYPELSGGQGGSAGEGTGLPSLFNFSHATRITPNRVCCNALLAAYARAKPPQYQRALHLLAAMWEGGPTLTPDAVSYNTAIKACANAFQVGRALDVHREMVRRGVKPSVTTFNSLITAASDAGSYDTLLEVGQYLAAADVDVQAAVMNTYVAGLVKVGHWEEALARYRDMLRPGSPARPTASTFNTVMSGHMRQGQYDKVRAVFEDMLGTGLAPSIVSYNTLLASYAALGAWREALDTLTHVLAAQGEGVNPNTTTFNTCLAAVSRNAPSIPAHQHALVVARVLQVFHQMRATAGCAADAATFASLVRILDACGHFPQVAALHDAMLACGHTPDAATAKLVLSAALQAGQMQKAFALAQSLQMQGEAVGAEALSSLMRACVGAGAWDLAQQLCNAALFAQGPKVSPLFDHLLERAAEAGRADVVLEALGAMRAADLPVPAHIANLLQVVSSQACGANTCTADITNIPAAGGTPAQSTFERAGSAPAFGGSFASLPAFANQATSPCRGLSLNSSPSTPGLPLPPLPPASPVVNGPLLTTDSSMPSPPPRFTISDANSLLRSIKEKLDAPAALAVLENMKLVGIQPDGESYCHLIELMARAGEPHAAVRLVVEAHEAGALSAYALPNLAAGEPQPGTALGNVVDLRERGAEVGVAVVLTWLTRCAQLRGAGLVVRDKHVKIICGVQPQRESADQVEGAAASALLSELACMLTSSSSRVPAFAGLVPVRLEPDAVSHTDDGSALLVSTHCLYKAFAEASC